MSWAMRRRLLYLLCLTLFFGTLLGVPVAYKILTMPSTCSDGVMNQGETEVDRGGPCPKLDAHYLAPSAVLWERAFMVRDGSYNAVAYVQNPNEAAGVASVPYQFRLYDEKDVLIADREGTMFVMPGGITPVFEPAIPTGARVVAHTFFDFMAPLDWQRATSTVETVVVYNKKVSNETLMPRITADAKNQGLFVLLGIEFIATVFDDNGNSFASSATIVDRFAPGDVEHLTFVWPEAFAKHVGRIDIIPLLPVQPLKQ